MALEMFKHRLTQNTPRIVNLDQKNKESGVFIALGASERLDRSHLERAEPAHTCLLSSA